MKELAFQSAGMLKNVINNIMNGVQLGQAASWWSYDLKLPSQETLDHISDEELMTL